MFRASLVCAAAIALAACASVKSPSATARGHEIARRDCGACHAVEPGAASPNPRAPGFATQEMRHTAGLEGRLEALTRSGHYDMPPVKLSPAEVRDLLAYIQGPER